MTKRNAGYTLIELLLAMSLFAALSTGLIALLARSSEFLTSGASQTETMDAIQTFAESFGADVSAMASRADSDKGMPEVRLYSDWADCDIDNDKKPDCKIPRLFFVRTIKNDVGKEAGQRSGLDVGKSKLYLDQGPLDAKKVADGTLRPSGGLMEVFWTALPSSKEDPSVMRIYRGFRAPPGGEGSLLPRKSWRDPSASSAEMGPISFTDVRMVARPVLEGVLYFGVDFWSRKTNTWDTAIRARNGGPIPTWDSTRGILLEGDDLDEFVYSRRQGKQDTSSLEDPTDDTFPRKIRVTCVVEELGKNARVGYLDQDLPADAKSIAVSDTRFFPLTETTKRFVKIEGEWMEVGLPNAGMMPVLKRGARGTVPATHKAGAKIHHGRTYMQEYDVATYRDTYRDELGTRVGRNR
jgi:prepilin-type N-terminal cleavage/methylation domain-containing protein